MSISIETLALAKKYAYKVGSGFSNVSFDQTTKSIVFTLKDGTKITFKVDDMVTDDQIQKVINSVIVVNDSESITDDTIISIDSESEEFEIVEKSEFDEVKVLLSDVRDALSDLDIDGAISLINNYLTN